MQALKYGAKVQGVNTATLSATRSMAAGVHGKLQGRSCTARLQIHGYDPAEDLVVASIMEWSCVIWEKRLPIEDLVMAWRRAKNTAGAQAHLQHSYVEGPSGAYLSALKRLQWEAPTPFVIVDGQGREFDLRESAPRTIKELAKMHGMTWRPPSLRFIATSSRRAG